jgi:hypothetical protein
MFDQNDIELLQERINVIWASEASPDIILMGKEGVSLRTIGHNLPLTRCTLLILYNRYKDRKMRTGIVGLAEIAASIAYTREDLRVIGEIISNDEYLLSLIGGNVMEELESLYGQELIVLAETPILISEYVRSLDYGIQRTYRTLKGMMNISRHILSIKAIIGGMFFGFEHRFSRDELIQALFNLEPRSSSRFIETDKIEDYIEWYRSKRRETLSVPKNGIATSITEVGFYPESFRKLDVIEENDKSNIYKQLQLYTPQVKTERYTIHPPVDIDVVDLISSATTSRQLPLIASDIKGRKIIKRYNRSKISPAWFMDIETNTMKIYVKTSHTKEKYQLIKYHIEDNYFLLESDSRRLPIDDIISILCSHLDVYWLTKPETYSSTYSFVSNRIPIDRDVLAWMITNPPTEYADTGIEQYVFVKEESKPNSLKDKTNIHIQLGEDKMYISTSQSKTTSGTIVPIPGAQWVAFQPDQLFFNVSINRTPNRAYTNICMNIYRHVMSMYFKYYAQVRRQIINMAMNIPSNPPIFISLKERIPSRLQEFKYIDGDLYNHVSTVASTLLPVPIDRSETHTWIEKGHTVLRLPNTILNFPSINILTSEEIWIRTPRPGTFLLVKKENDDYIPIQNESRGFGIVLDVHEDGTVEGHMQYVTPTTRVLNEKSSTFAKVDRLVSPSETLNIFLRPMAETGTLIFRMGISPNIIHTLVVATNTSMTPKKIARYAYLCRQECWNQEESDIEEDILQQRIDPQKHFRALEEAFSINLFFLEEDMVEPIVLKPPHYSFYLHRRSNPNRRNIIFHKDKRQWTLVVQRLLTSSIIIRSFSKGGEYLDDILDQTNIIHMISPEKGTDNILTYKVPAIKIGPWKAYEQVIDDYGKVRGITYKNGSRIATVFVGFSPILSPINGEDIYMGTVVTPSTSRSNKSIDIVREIQWMKKEYLLIPDQNSSFNVWKKREKDARILRAVVVLLWSQSNMSIDDFIDEHLIIDDRVSYDTSMMKNALPPLLDMDAWEYFSSVLGGDDSDAMIRMNDVYRYIVVPTEETLDALRLYLGSTPRVAWPSSFPHFVIYSWDIKSQDTESVFLLQEHALANLMMEAYPTESDELVVSPVAYVLRQGSDRYLIQMGRDYQHVRCLAYEWINTRRNSGFSNLCDIDEEYLPMVEEVTSFTPKIEVVSYIFHSTHIFLIIPL